MIKTRICVRCKKEKDVQEFFNSKGVLIKTCKYCSEQQKEWHKNNAARIKLWEDRNKNKRNRQRKEWRENNPSYSAEWARNNVEKVRGYRVKNASFSVYSERLTIDEDPICGENNTLYVKCFRCGKYFSPSRKIVKSRIESLEGKQKGESHLYCSEECKQACPIYSAQKYYGKKIPPNPARDMKWVKMVLTRDNFTCKKCGSKDNLQAHHIIPIAVDPIISADIDNGITLCKKCHDEVHLKDGCNIAYLAKLNKC